MDGVRLYVHKGELIVHVSLWSGGVTLHCVVVVACAVQPPWEGCLAYHGTVSWVVCAELWVVCAEFLWGALRTGLVEVAARYTRRRSPLRRIRWIWRGPKPWLDVVLTGLQVSL